MSNQYLNLLWLSCFAYLFLILVLRATLKEEDVDPQAYTACSGPIKSVVFHKTHKTASSTVQNILLRYAKKQELNVVIPDGKVYQLFPEDRFTINGSGLAVSKWFKAGLKPHIFCLHNRWNGQEVAKLIPRNQSIYFTILREPVSLFVSLWDFYPFPKVVNTSNINFFVQNKSNQHNDTRLLLVNLRNSLSYEFGLDPQHFDNMTKVDEKIAEIEATFDLVMIMDQFEESMVLLKHQLCWEYADLTSLKLNAHSTRKPSVLTNDSKEKLTQWLQADLRIYQHFKARLQESILTFGSERMTKERSIMKKANEELAKTCKIKYVSRGSLPRNQRPPGRNIKPYVTYGKDPECPFVGMYELSFLDYIRNLQSQRASKVS